MPFERRAVILLESAGNNFQVDLCNLSKKQNMSVHLVATKEILSFHELERRKLFDHNKRLLAVRLEAMEREIKHLTKDYNKDFTPKGPAKTIKITSQPIIQPEEELERERNWPRTEDHLFQRRIT